MFRNRTAHLLAKIFSDKLLLSLILFFACMYLPHVFILVKDIGLISAYEVDPGSHIDAIENILKGYRYNMHAGYHSKYYGWTYFSINYFLLAPIKMFCSLFGIENKFYLYVSIKLIFFSIGLMSLIAFYMVTKKIFSSKVLPFLAGVIYVLSDAGYQYFYFIHPETTGTMFMLFAVLCLLHFIDNPKNYRLYFYGLMFLVLASLSKQIFFFVSLPILFSFLHFHRLDQKKKLFNLIFSKDFYRILSYSSIIALCVLFIIHPFAFIQIKRFIAYQQEFRMFVSGDNVLSLTSACKIWLKIFTGIPIVMLSFCLFPISIIWASACYLKSKQSGYYLYLVNAVALIVLSFMIASGNRLFPWGAYIQPLYPFFILNLLALVSFAYNAKPQKLKFLKVFATMFFTYFILLSICFSIYNTIPRVFDRLDYKDSVAYLTYNFIQKNLDGNDRIAYDHFVALPSSMKDQGCHYWTDCANAIEDFNPNYVMFNNDWTLHGKQMKETKRLIKYVEDHNLQLVEELKTDTIKILIYKKAKQ